MGRESRDPRPVCRAWVESQWLLQNLAALLVEPTLYVQCWALWVDMEDRHMFWSQVAQLA